MRIYPLIAIFASLALQSSSLPVGAQEAAPKTKQGPTPGARYPGPTENGYLLPNGWTISPAGEQVTLTDLPLNILPLADNRHAVVGTG